MARLTNRSLRIVGETVRSERGPIENGTRRRVRLMLVTGGQHGETVVVRTVAERLFLPSPESNNVRCK